MRVLEAPAASQTYPAEVVRGTFFEHDVPLSKMFVHFRTESGGYARPLRPWRVNKLMSEFDRQALGVILLSMRNDGTFAVIDGQHRKDAAERMGLTAMDALVFIDLSLEDEARLYRKFGDYLKQTPFDRYHAGVAERLPEYLGIQRVLHELGLHVPHIAGGGLHGVDAVDALVKVATTYRLEGLNNALRLLFDAWDGEPRVYRSLTIIGTAMFLARFQDHPSFNRKRLVTRMKREGLSKVERQAFVIRDANLAPNPNSGWGQALLQLHDKGQPPGNELGEWPKRHLSEVVVAKLAATMRKTTAAMTPEQRSAIAYKANAALTPEQRSERSARGNETRRNGSGAVDPRTVKCRICRAGVGQTCITDAGRRAKASHRVRYEDVLAGGGAH